MRTSKLHLSIRITTAALLSVSAAAVNAADKPKPSAPKPAAAPKAAPKAAAAPAAGRSGPATPAATGRGSTATAGRAGSPATAAHTQAAAGGGGRGATPAVSRTGAPARSGERVTHTAGGGEVHRGANGQVHEVHAHGMEIHHGPGGSRTVIRERGGHEVVYSNRYGHGYVQHGYRYHDAEFVHRTYYYNGVAYGRVYRPYFYGGVAINVYAPGLYYAPGFYGWAYNPWVAPVAYGWGWAGNPWYGYYGAYFTPYPVYASPSLWLTDYLVAQTLQAAYLERQAELANAQPAAAPTPMTPEVKQLISEEVRRQVALENAESQAAGGAPPDPASSGIARMLGDNMAHVFVVSAALDLTSNAGDCPVTEGDVLQLNPGTPPNSTAASLVVMASKGQDCRRGSTVTVGVADLQEMQNHMRETLDQGLAELQAKQGKGGLPAAPASATKPPVQTAFAAVAPPPDPNAATELSQQAKEADSAEREVLSQDGGSAQGGANPEPVAAPAAPATTLSLGQTPDEVKASLGQPKNIVDLGAKKIYVFKDLKVTFTNGKVTDIQ